MNRTWHPIALLSAALLFLYFVFFSQLGLSKPTLAVAVLVVFFVFIFMFVQIVRGFLRRELKWPILQTLGLVLHAAALIPALYLVGLALINYSYSAGFNPKFPIETIEAKIREKCSNEMTLKCSNQAYDLEALSICLNNLEPYFHLSPECTEAAGLEMTFPPLLKARQIGKALLPQGTRITRHHGRIILVESPTVLIFGEAYCRPGIIHWSYAQSSGTYDDTNSYVHACYLEGDQVIGGIKFKANEKLKFWEFGTPRATFFSSSGKVLQGVLSEPQMIDGVWVQPKSDAWTYFDETGKLKTN